MKVIVQFTTVEDPARAQVIYELITQLLQKSEKQNENPPARQEPAGEDKRQGGRQP